MADNKIELAEQIERGVAMLSWFAHGAHALRRIGSLEQAERETNEKLNKVREELRQAQGKLQDSLKAASEAEQRSQALEAKAKESLAEVGKIADGIQANANQKAKEALVDAEARAAVIVSDATKQYEEMKSRHDREKRKLDFVERKLEEQTKALGDLERKIEQAGARLIKELTA